MFRFECFHSLNNYNNVCRPKSTFNCVTTHFDRQYETNMKMCRRRSFIGQSRIKREPIDFRFSLVITHRFASQFHSILYFGNRSQTGLSFVFTRVDDKIVHLQTGDVHFLHTSVVFCILHFQWDNVMWKGAGACILLEVRSRSSGQ